MGRRILVASLALTALGLGGCGGDGPSAPGNGGSGGGTTPASIVVSAGNNQRIIVGGQLAAPLRVRVADAQNRGVAGVAVKWEVTQGGGSLSAATSTTNTVGEATVTFTAGANEEDNTITASVADVSGTATFTAAAVAPAAITAAAGDNQEVRIGVTLADLVARVTASDGGPVPGATVDWQVTAGEASVAAASSTADSDGRASIVATAGNTPGALQITASSQGSGATTNFNAQVSAPVSVTVTMENIAFNAPGGGDDITIMLGDTVRWVNNDGVQHTATSNQTPTGGTSFGSGLMAQNAEFEFVPNVRGTWVYFCTVHPVQMAGASITVD